jgi:hypothetical protein
MNRQSNPVFSRLSVAPFSRRTAVRLAGQGAIAASLLTWLEPVRVTVARQPEPPQVWSNPEATRDAHGQLIVGGGPIYLSHFPFFMFDTPEHHPHHFQVILEVTFTGDAGDPLAAYLADKGADETALYTFAPSFEPDELVRMLDLIGLTTAAGKAQALPGAIVRGHFERLGASVVQDSVMANVDHVIYAHEFAFDAQPLEALEYILFGQGENLFLAHRIVVPPSFDQVLPVEIEGHTFADEALRSGIIVVLPERSDTIADRLRDGESEAGEAWWRGQEDEETPTKLTITAGPEIFFEESELFRNGQLTTTEAEREGGFGS